MLAQDETYGITDSETPLDDLALFVVVNSPEVQIYV